MTSTDNSSASNPERTVLASGFAFDTAAAAAHVMEPIHTQGVISSRGLEEGATSFKLPETGQDRFAAVWTK
jgi:hypothetical protein